MKTSRISKITIGRLYNLGSYEHVRYELTVEVPEGKSAEKAVRGMENILEGLKPYKSSVSSEIEIKRRAAEIEKMKTMPAVQWEREFGHYEGTPAEIIERFEKSLQEDIEKREAAISRAKRARELFDDLGGASQFKDAKLDWDDDEY